MSAEHRNVAVLDAPLAGGVFSHSFDGFVAGDALFNKSARLVWRLVEYLHEGSGWVPSTERPTSGLKHAQFLRGCGREAFGRALAALAGRFCILGFSSLRGALSRDLQPVKLPVASFDAHSVQLVAWRRPRRPNESEDAGEKLQQGLDISDHKPLPRKEQEPHTVFPPES